MGTKKMPNLFRPAEPKQTFAYRKLVVPLSMRSIYWKYFGFPANENEEILTKVKIVCTLCKLQIAYNRNTSNLRMHLQNKHLIQLQNLEEQAPEKPIKIKQERSTEKYHGKKQGRSSSDGAFLHPPYSEVSDILDDTGEEYITDTAIQIECDSDDMEWESRTVEIDRHPEVKRYNRQAETASNVFSLDKDAMTEYMIVDLEPGCIVEGRGFQSLVATMRSPCEIPDKDKLEDFLIPKVYNTVKDTLHGTIVSLPGKTGLTLEEWTHSNGQVFVTINVHFLSDSYESLQRKVLNTVHCSEFTDWNFVIDQLVFEWQLKLENVTAVVMATSESKIFDAFQEKGIITIPCIVHSLQSCAKSIFELKDVAQILSRIRSMVSMITSSLTASTALQIQIQINSHHTQSEDVVLKMDYPKAWVSTYKMLETFRILKGEVESIMSNIEGVTIDKKEVCLSNKDWQIIEDLISVLLPLKVTIQTLGEENNPLISLLKPLLWQLTGSHLKREDADSEMASNYKNIISQKLQAIYSNFDTNLTLQTAMALDPRFKQFPYESEDDKGQVMLNIKEQLDKIIASSKDDNEDETQLLKKSKVSGLQYMLGSLCTPEHQPGGDKSSSELLRFASEPAAPLDESPPAWWARTSERCPNLAQLAQNYTCVPSIAVPVARVPVEAQILFDQKRARIAPELVDKLLFLNGNFGIEDS